MERLQDTQQELKNRCSRLAGDEDVAFGGLLEQNRRNNGKSLKEPLEAGVADFSERRGQKKSENCDADT